MPGQRQSQRELRLLAPRQLSRLAPERDSQLGKPGLGVGLVEVSVQVARQVQHVGSRHVLVERRVLGDECDAVQSGERPRCTTAENGEAALRWRRKADCQAQQRALASAVRTDQCRHVTGGDGEGAIA